jgi:hypothetical protein
MRRNTPKITFGKVASRAASFVVSAASEAGIGAAEYAAHFLTGPVIRHITPAGDGHAVGILSGFLMDTWHAAPLEKRITDKGFTVFSMNEGINLGSDHWFRHEMPRKLERAYRTYGKISLVGISDGAPCAQELAREYPQFVRDVHMIAGPVNLENPELIAGSLRTLYKWLNPKAAHLMEDAEMIRRFTTPLPAPIRTVTYTVTTDRAVLWQASLKPADPMVENVRIFAGSHVALPANPFLATAVLDRLAEKPATWKTFDSVKYGALFYPPVPQDILPENPGWQPGPDSVSLFGGEENGNRDPLNLLQKTRFGQR